MNQPYPRLPDFKYQRPTSMQEAIAFLEKHKTQSRPYAGGTDCFVQIRDRRYLPEYMVDLKSIPELSKIDLSAKDGLKIGATASMNALIHHPQAASLYPILMDSAREVAGYQLRTRATVVGNICNASPCGDTIGACMVYDGVIHMVSKAGERSIPLSEFFTGPGKTLLQRGEFATAVTLPVPKTGTRGSYKSIGRNKLGDLAIAAVTVLGYPDDACQSGFSFRIALTAVAPTVIFAAQAQQLLCEKKPDTRVIAEAAKLCADASKPIDDIRGSAEYRKDMIRVLARRGLSDTCEQLGVSL